MTRETLPCRRPSETVKFQHGGLRHYGTVSHYDDGRVAEIFLDTGKIGSAYQAMARDLAVAASLALQHGCPPETLLHALTRDDKGHAAGPLGKLLDMIFGEASP